MGLDATGEPKERVMASKAAREAANRISETVAFMTTDDEATAAAIIDDALREEREAGDRLAQAVHDYRIVHDSRGDDHIETGRVWDRMRRAEAAYREARGEGAAP
jgi:hypothetical protein